MHRRPSYYFVQLTGANLQELLFQSIRHKSRSINIYTNLLNQSPDEFITSMLSSIQATELNTQSRLEEDFMKAYGPIPSYTIEQPDIAYATFLDGVLLALRYNSEVITFEREVLDKLGEGRLGHDLYDYMLRADMGQQDILNTLYTYYLHEFELHTRL